MSLVTSFLKKIRSYFLLVLVLCYFSGFSQDDFETWPLSFDVTDSGITVTEETTIVDEGDSSASVEVTTGTQASTDWRKNINLTSGVTYTISFKIYHTEGHVRTRIYCDGWQNYSIYGTTGSWQTLSYDFTPSSTDSFAIGLRFYDIGAFDGSEIVYVDDFTIGAPITYSSNTTISDSQTYGEVTINSEVTLTIAKTGNLTVNTDIINSGTIVLESDSNEFGSIIYKGSSSETITYNRYVNSLSSGEGWDLIGSPVNGLQISSFVTTNDFPLATGNGSDAGASGEYAIGYYDNSANEWTNYTSGTVGSTQFTPGKGYQMATDSGATVAFTGTIDVAATETISVENFDDGSGTQWVLLSNPYPSFIRSGPNSTTDTFLEVNDGVIDDTYLGVYGYDAETSLDVLYDIYNNTSTAKIAPGQGFMVAARSNDAATITFKEEMQTTSTGDDFISGNFLEDSQEIVIKLYHENNVMGSTKLYFKDILTLGLDPGWDAGAFDQNAALMTRLVEDDQGHGLAINAMSTEDMDDVVIPLEINQTSGQEFRINLHTSTIGEVNIYLEDTELETLTLLNDEDFVFTPSSDLSDVGRFYVHLTADTLSNEEVNTSLLNAYKKVDQNYITIEGLATQAASTAVSLFNILGTKVMDTTLDNTVNTQTVSTNGLSTGIYIIKLVSGENQLTKKLIIK